MAVPNGDDLFEAAVFSVDPFVSFDGDGNPVWFNIAAHVMFGDVLNYPLMDEAKLNNSASFLTLKKLAQVEPGYTEKFIESKLDLFGDVALRVRSSNRLSLRTGEDNGKSISIKIVSISAREDFEKRLEFETIKQKSWKRYAISYDHVLPLIPFYSDTVDRHFSALHGAQRILDLGAGTGNLSLRFIDDNVDILAIDSSFYMTEIFRRKLESIGDNSIKSYIYDAKNIGLIAGKKNFDGVNILLSLYDMNEPEAVLASVSELVDIGGKIVITEPRRTIEISQLIEIAEETLTTKSKALSKSEARRLRQHFDVVYHENEHRDPKRVSGFGTDERSSRLWTDDIAQLLIEFGFSVEHNIESHKGHCETIIAVKR